MVATSKSRSIKEDGGRRTIKKALTFKVWDVSCVSSSQVTISNTNCCGFQFSIIDLAMVLLLPSLCLGLDPEI